ncbi:zinc ABC transporter solute-binding protein [Thermoleophilia bacterium SCSIO 60948]|nr:zinc ABC transporter solute-binding protein [Thermoleophilia bacterium SCSIO 60948]
MVASTTVVGDLARNVAGDRASVETILPANADPHDYEPQPSDAVALGSANLILGSGGEVDLWLGELTESSGSDAPEVELIDSVSTIEGGHEHEEGEDERSGADHSDYEHAEDEVDPHWWQDPRNTVAAVEAIRGALIEADPDGRADYEANADAYIERIEKLDSAVEACMDEVPAAERKLVTSHDALGYFADRYDIEVVGSTIPALTTQAQPSAGETAELVELIRTEDVNAVFPELGVSAKLEQAVAEESGAEVGGELYADTLGPEGSDGDSYLGMIASNARTIVDGFSAGSVTCDLPAER